MSDVAQPVTQAGLAGYYAEGESFHRGKSRLVKAVNWALVVISLISMLGNLAQSLTIRHMVPLIRLVPVFYWVQADGTVDASTSPSMLPPTKSEALIRSDAFRYVKDREGYSYANAQDAYDRVRAMSTDHVNDAFQKSFALSNPDSPQHRPGSAGQINIIRIGFPTFVRDRVVQVRYLRMLEMYDAPRPDPLLCKPPICTTWTATLDIAYVDALDANARLLNPTGMVVTRYQVAEGAQ